MTEESRERPTLVEGLRAVLQADWDDDTEFNRAEVRILSTGEVAYRLYPADGSDYEGGVAVIE
jgi:hypothetical protein